MSVTIATMRAAGLSDSDIVRVLAVEEKERLERKRAGDRERQRRRRARIAAESVTDVTPVTSVTRDECDPPSSVSPPSMVSPNTPSLTTPSSTPPSISRAVAKATRSEIADRFEEFWRVYPRRDGANPKRPASKKFEAAIRSGADPSAIIAGAKAYASDEAAKERVGTSFIAQAATWLNQHRWEDYAAAAAPDRPRFYSPPPGSGLPTDEELRARHAKRGETSESTGTGEKLLAESPGICDQKSNGVVCDQTGHGGMERMAEFFRWSTVDSMGDTPSGEWQLPNVSSASAMAAVVRSSPYAVEEDLSIPGFLRRI